MRVKIKYVQLVLVVVLVCGCATPYQQNSALNFLMPGGFTDERVDETTYHIKFVGNGNTTEEKVGRYLLFRCAELTREHGFRYFVFLPAELTGGLSMDAGPRPTGLNRPMLMKTSYSGGVILLPGGWATAIRSKAVTIQMLQDPRKVPFRMMGWDVNDVFAALEPYVRTGGDQSGHVPPAFVFDPKHGLVSYKSGTEGKESSQSPIAKQGGYNGSVSMDTLEGLLPANDHAP